MIKLPIHKFLQPLLWLEGSWISEEATGQFPTIAPFKYCEELSFSSIGQPVLNYTAQSWNPETKRPMHREVGVLKIHPNTSKVSLLLSHNFGLNTIEEGEVLPNELVLHSKNISRYSSEPIVQVTKIKRELKLVEGKLHHTLYMATNRTPELTQHLHTVYVKKEECT